MREDDLELDDEDDELELLLAMLWWEFEFIQYTKATRTIERESKRRADKLERAQNNTQQNNKLKKRVIFEKKENQG